jgi:hypothetical protein
MNKLLVILFRKNFHTVVVCKDKRIKNIFMKSIVSTKRTDKYKKSYDGKKGHFT